MAPVSRNPPAIHHLTYLHFRLHTYIVIEMRRTEYDRGLFACATAAAARIIREYYSLSSSSLSAPC
eukprot:scaffold20880_cov106-Skeletonema_dohrnii-CCMP3373.AAC.1